RCRNEIGPRSRHTWRRTADDKLRLAAGLHWNWPYKPALVTAMDEVETPWRTTSGFPGIARFSYRYLPATKVLGNCGRWFLRCVSSLFHDHVASVLSGA